MVCAGLVIDPKMHDGFTFEVLDTYTGKAVKLSTPAELYDLLALIGSVERYAVRSVWRNSDGEIAAVASTQRLSLIAGRYVGKDDPVLIVRAQSGFPAVGEVLEPFARPWIVEGWMRGSHNGPLMPVSFKQATPTRFDGPPRVIAAGYQIANGKLIGQGTSLTIQPLTGQGNKPSLSQTSSGGRVFLNPTGYLPRRWNTQPFPRSSKSWKTGSTSLKRAERPPPVKNITQKRIERWKRSIA